MSVFLEAWQHLPIPLIPIEQGRAFAALLEGAVFKTFAGSGHYLHNERPDEFVRAVREFLDDPTVPATRLRQSAKQVTNSLPQLRDPQMGPRPRLVE